MPVPDILQDASDEALASIGMAAGSTFDRRKRLRPEVLTVHVRGPTGEVPDLAVNVQ
jgi:hypothetical protein